TAGSRRRNFLVAFIEKIPLSSRILARFAGVLEPPMSLRPRLLSAAAHGAMRERRGKEGIF
ncbi:MAG: hypothetical protein II191_02790, partial [Clostridia bacterium]|nr:hypothetical protein [Clostridia bacterium]